MNANRNITRIDRESSGGYLVRIMRKGKKTSKFFSDSENGGKKKALTAARAFRDGQEKKMKGYTSKELSKIMRSNNTSGVVGVRLVEEVDMRWPSQPTYLYWVAQWSPKKGVRKTKRFSVEKYGDEEAYRLACLARKKGVSAMKA
ncbi:AP2/ERF family transcription factor [Novipirellula artificiosorum]|uniref:AP2 domain protein n=1 Tax=Novipirellula artificiosorum TaxID=2528016 RepID=A0A5C6DSR6_9BACT|nr:AP2/ERF family transcription factor [Novipirellula artificiosorum]TWU39244.1 AP2 domain protein [Novipirellula artificiosorum]